MKRKTAKTKTKTVVEPALKRRPGRVQKEKYPHNATWLRTQMIIQGISQRDYAAALGAKYPTVNHLISGRRPMRDDDAKVMAKLLKMPLDVFLERVRNTEPVRMPAELERAMNAGDLEITGWVDSELNIHEGKPKGPGTAPGLPTGEVVRVVRCQTTGSVFDSIDGALVYYKELADVPADSVGRMCVVKIKGGKTALRVVRRGYSVGGFNLSLLNGVLSEEDAHLTTASPVIWLKP